MPKITNADLLDAAQAYRMQTLTSDQLQELIDEHEHVPCVASEAIALAARSTLSTGFYTTKNRR